jgi:hypothetical protein
MKRPRLDEAYTFGDFGLEFMNFGDLGVICLNRGLKEECQDCLWREWDSVQGFCSNRQSLVCVIYRQNLLLTDFTSPSYAKLPG